MNKLFQYVNDTYGFCTYLYIGNDRNLMRKAVAKEKFWDLQNFDECAEDFAGEYAGCTTTLKSDTGSVTHFVHLPSWTGSEDNIESLSHEMGHVAHRALVHRGWSDFTNEDVFHSYLYLHGSLFRKFLEEVLRAKKQKKSKKK